jgi:hypothetical protein
MGDIGEPRCSLSWRSSELGTGGGLHLAGPYMEQPRPALPHHPQSSQVLVRFLIRLTLVIAVASFGAQAFGALLSSLLALSGAFCAVMGFIRHEPIFGPVLTHWDEAVACAVLGHLVAVLS